MGRKKISRNIRKMFVDEEGQFGVESIMMYTLFIVTLILIYAVNSQIVSMSWKGFITNMQPDYLYPPFDGGYGTYPGRNVISAAIYLQQNVVMKDIVNPLFLLILLLLGLAYIYSDIFEQYFGKIKTLLPRVVFGLILAYASLYVLEALMILGKAGYLIFYNQPILNAWKNKDYIITVVPDVRVVSSSSPWAMVNEAANVYWHYLWVFIIMVEAISLLIFVAFRMVLLAVLIVLLPIASILLIHPWTQSIGSRLWWLAVSLVFIPIVMIIPLMLSTVVGNSVSFFIASLTAILGSIYLISKDPGVLGGVGFQKAGNLLTGGVVGGGATGNMLLSTAKIAGGGAGKMAGKLYGGITDKIIDKGLDKVFEHVGKKEDGGKGEHSTTVYNIAVGKMLVVNLSDWASNNGGVEK